MGSSGISGNPGNSGLSGTSGNSGTSGTAGSSGNAGNSGTSGTSGDEYWVIASHSHAFTQDYTLGSTTYYYGDDTCGWSGCDWDLTGTDMMTESIKICPINMNVLITNPFRLQSGDIIQLCGNSSKDNKTDTGLGYILGYHNCNDEVDSNGKFTTTALFSGSSAYTVPAYSCNEAIYKYQCFSDSIILSSTFDACEIQFFVGFNILGTTNTNTPSRVSWTLSVWRPG